MKITEVTALGIRIFGILFLLKLASSFAAWYMSIDTSVEPSYSKIQLLFTYILPFLFSLMAIKFPVFLAKLLVSSSSQPSKELETDGKSIQLAAFVIFGVFILSYAIPNFIHSALMIIALNNAEAQIDKYPYYIKEITTTIELSIGLYLAIGANGIYKTIARLRNTVDNN
jgi:hypothetical protein